ncbi:MAG: lipid II:glycine glycyltransferase FemX [Chloroflexota bacterium]
MSISVGRWEDRASWNTFVAAQPRAHFQQSWEWGELAPSLGGRAVRLGATVDGSLIGAMQVFVQPLSRTGRSHLYVPRGPVLVDDEALAPLMMGARELGREERAVGIRLEPNEPQGCERYRREMTRLDLRQVYPPSQPRSSWMLDIRPEPKELLSGMKQKTRYNIRLAERKGVEVSEGHEEDLPGFYALFKETAERDEFFIHDLDVYRRMFGLFWKAGNFRLLLARHEDELIAAVTLVKFGSTCWYLQGASSARHRNLMATYLLQWEAIRWAREQGCAVYDFRAVPDRLEPDQDMYGVYRFKEGFGGHQLTTEYTWAAAYRQPWFDLWQLYFGRRFAFDAWRRRRRGLPARQFA